MTAKKPKAKKPAKKQKYVTMYMHTLDDLPATFLEDGIYINRYRSRIHLESLRDIRRQQRISEENNLPNSGFIRGYRLVRVPVGGGK